MNIIGMKLINTIAIFHPLVKDITTPELTKLVVIIKVDILPPIAVCKCDVY
jgi:hypothetical protein